MQIAVLISFVVVIGAALATNKAIYDNDVGPCSSTYYHKHGKCGDAKHSFLRCQQGYACSRFGYCGQGESYLKGAICPPETRPDTQPKQFRPAADDNDYEAPASVYEMPAPYAPTTEPDDEYVKEEPYTIPAPYVTQKQYAQPQNYVYAPANPVYEKPKHYDETKSYQAPQSHCQKRSCAPPKPKKKCPLFSCCICGKKSKKTGDAYCRPDKC